MEADFLLRGAQAASALIGSRERDPYVLRRLQGRR